MLSDFSLGTPGYVVITTINRYAVLYVRPSINTYTFRC